MELARIEKNIIVVDMPNKISEFKALENPKLRDYPQEVKNANTSKLIEYLLNLLGVASGKAEITAIAFEFINTNLGKWTYQEIKLAFDMYVAHKFDISPFQQLNAIVIGKVMKCYENHLKTQIEAYEKARREQLNKETELTEEQKQKIIVDNVIDHYKHWLDTGEIFGATDPIYFYHEEHGNMPKWTKEEDNEAKEEAAMVMVTKAKNEGKLLPFEGLMDNLQSKNATRLDIEKRKILLRKFYESK